MARKSKKRFGVLYYHRGHQRFYSVDNLTLDECKEKFKHLKQDMYLKDEITYVVAFESMKSYSAYDGWCDYRVKEI